MRQSATQTEQAPTEQAVPTATRLVAVVTAVEALHVRTGPGVQFPHSFYLLSGWQVEIVGDCQDGWVKIRYRGLEGWVNADYLTNTKCKD